MLVCTQPSGFSILESMNPRTRDIVHPRRRPRRGARARPSAATRPCAPAAQGSGASQVARAGADCRRRRRPAAAEPQYDRWTVGVAQRPLTVVPARRRRARRSAPGCRCRRRPTTRWSCSSTPSRTVGGVTWYKVWVPVPPNETPGWVRGGAAGLLHDLVQDRHRPLRAQAQRLPPRRAWRARSRSPSASPGSPRPTGLLLHHPEAAGRRTRTASTACCSSAPAPSSPS